MKTPVVERRFVDLVDVEVRDGDGDNRVFNGYAAVFNQWADIGGMFREQVAPGAFKKTIREADVPFVFNHDDSTVMARTSNGALRLSEDKKGLAVEADLDPADADASRLITKLEAGNVSKMSFAFRTLKDEWDEENEPPKRTLREVQLFDVSPVTSPAYQGTSAQLRTEARAVMEAHGFELPDEDAFTEALRALVETPGVPDIFDSEQVRAVIQTLEALLSRAEPPDEEVHLEEHSLDLEAARRIHAIRMKRLAMTA